MYQNDFAKEFLRKMFTEGTLDITGSVDDLMAFCRIFSGEMEALQAIRICTFLTEDEVGQALLAANPSPQTERQLNDWLKGG